MPRTFRYILALLSLLAAPAAWASFHLFQIQEIFSNADGTVQYVVLHETAGMNGENFLGGHTFTSTSGGTTQTYTFPMNLPGGEGFYGPMPSPTAFAHVLIATQGFAQLGLVTPDYVIPNGFLPLANGTINYAGVDQVSYMALPTDGVSAVNRNGAMQQNLATNFSNDSASVAAGPPPLMATAVEYYYSAWNFYFETAFPAEIAALDGGAFGGVWQRTGQTFTVWTDPSASPAATPTCRFFSTIFAPKSSHFYTPFAAECAGLKAGTAWQYESIAFYIALADANGACPAGTIPLYRAYDNGMGGAPNHRYTTSLTILNQMIAAGWLFEGNGNNMVFACVPQ
jgi:hypothetical protein